MDEPSARSRGDEEPSAHTERELAALRADVLALTKRVQDLEQRGAAATPPPLPERTRPTRQVPTRPAPPPLPDEFRDWAPRSSPRTPARGARGAWWQVGVLKRVSVENLPVVAMGAAGGLALLMGVLYFAWYSIQQGWISPAIRLSVTALFGVVALAFAWRLGAREQKAVAASLGGAGLGGWFGAVLVARHVHGYLGPGTTFLLLALGAAAGLVIAGHRRLRLLAGLAALGAMTTPLVVGSGEDRLNELMAYQLVVVGFLFVLERARRWPELGHLALAGTWVLLFAWSSVHLDGPHRPAMLAWSAAMLVVGHAHTWELVRREALSVWHAAPRLGLHALLAWVAAATATREAHAAAYVALAMAAWNGGVPLALLRLGARAGEAPRSSQPGAPAQNRALALGAGACLSIAWLQLFTFAPQRWDGVLVLVWWTAMASATVPAQLMRGGVRPLVAMLTPYAAAVLWSAAHAGRTEASLGFFLAALPLLLALWRRPAGDERFRPREALLLLGGGLVWAWMSWHHIERVPRDGWVSLACLVGAAAVVLRVLLAPGATRCLVTLFLLAALIAQSLGIALEHGLLRPDGAEVARRVWQLATLAGVAGLAFATTARFRRLLDRAPDSRWLAAVHDLAGLLWPLATLVALLVAVTLAVPSLTSDASSARSLNQAGWSIVAAVTSLGLLLRGLFAHRTVWRRAGIALLFVTAAKLVVVDLVGISMELRVLSFVGLGVCLLAGAYAYRALARSAAAAGPPK